MATGRAKVASMELSWGVGGLWSGIPQNQLLEGFERILKSTWKPQHFWSCPRQLGFPARSETFLWKVNVSSCWEDSGNQWWKFDELHVTAITHWNNISYIYIYIYIQSWTFRDPVCPRAPWTGPSGNTSIASVPNHPVPSTPSQSHGTSAQSRLKYFLNIMGTNYKLKASEQGVSAS